jgi:cytochrome c-type biogenesis protein CcmE
MKISHIIAILGVAVITGIIITTFSGSGTYSHFEEAFANPGRDFHIIGTLNTAKPLEYDSRIDHNLFAFYMFDQQGNESKVIYRGAKPQDFEKSEQVVIIGNAESENVFLAKQLLLKCPTKYNEDGLPQEFDEASY